MPTNRRRPQQAPNPEDLNRIRARIAQEDVAANQQKREERRQELRLLAGSTPTPAEQQIVEARQQEMRSWQEKQGGPDFGQETGVGLPPELLPPSPPMPPEGKHMLGALDLARQGLQRTGEFFRRDVPEGGKQAGLGAASGLLKAAQGMSQLYGPQGSPFAPQQTQTALTQAQEQVKAKADEDHFMFQMGEFAGESAPYIAAGSGAARGAAALASRLPGMFQSGAGRVGLETGAQALAGAGTTAALGGDLDEQIETGAIFGAMPVAGKALGLVGRGFTRWIPEKLMNSFFKVSSDVSNRTTRSAVGTEFPDYGKEIIKREWMGKPLKMGQLSHAQIELVEAELQGVAKKATQRGVNPKVPAEELEAHVNSLRLLDEGMGEHNEYWGLEGGKSIRNSVIEPLQAILNTLPKGDAGKLIKPSQKVPVPTELLLKARRFGDAVRSHSSFTAMKDNSILSNNQENLRSMTNRMRENLRTVPGLQKLLDEQAVLIRMRELLAKSAQSETNRPFMNVMDGAIVSAMMVNPSYGAPAAILRGLTTEGLIPRITKVTIAKGLHNLGKATSGSRQRAVGRAAVRGAAGVRFLEGQEQQRAYEQQRQEAQEQVRPGSRVQIDVNNLRPVR